MIPEHNLDLEEKLDTLPDQVATALQAWEVTTLERERLEALLYAKFKGEDPDRKTTDIKALINASQERYTAVLDEIKAHSEYERLNGTLLAMKRKANLRTSF